MSSLVRCATPILGQTLRIISLNACGVPITGTGSAQIVTDAWVEVTASPQYDTGDRKITRKANGLLCVNTKLPDQFTNEELTINFCAWNPGVIPATLGGTLLTQSESPTGTGASYGRNANLTAKHWSLELWTGVDGDAACDSTGTQRYFYEAWPHLSDGKLGDRTFGNDPSQLQIKANTFPVSTLWTAGASWLGAGATLDDYVYNLTTVAPPASACVVANYP
jgi:hypothetical protein